MPNACHSRTAFKSHSHSDQSVTAAVSYLPQNMLSKLVGSHPGSKVTELGPPAFPEQPCSCEPTCLGCYCPPRASLSPSALHFSQVFLPSSTQAPMPGSSGLLHSSSPHHPFLRYLSSLPCNSHIFCAFPSSSSETQDPFPDRQCS